MHRYLLSLSMFLMQVSHTGRSIAYSTSGKNRESGTYKAPKRTIQCVKGAQHLDDYPIYVLGT